MTDQPPQTEPECEDAREAADMGEKPDLGHKADALINALEGTDTGSDTRAGSLRGGSASGSEVDPDSAEINRTLAEEGEALADPESPSNTEPGGIEGSGRRFSGEAGDPVEGARGAD